MLPALSVRPDVGGLENRQRVLLRHCACSPICVRNSYTERALTEPRPNQHRLAVPFALLADDERGLRRRQTGGSLLAFMPDSGALAKSQVIALVSQVPCGPVCGLRDPLFRREEHRLD